MGILTKDVSLSMDFSHSPKLKGFFISFALGERKSWNYLWIMVV